MVTVPLMANTVMGKEPFAGALWLLRMTGFIPAGAVLGGWLLSAIGIRTVTVAGLALTALGLFLVSTWPVSIAEPQLTLHLAIAGSGFGLVIAPIATRALNAVSINYRGTAASLVVVARMLGMTLGLAALSAWGVEHFQVLTAGLEFPVPMPGESAEAAEERLMEYNAELTAAGLSLFHNFLRVAATVSLVAIVPAFLMLGDKRG
jgi:MFS family permease